MQANRLTARPRLALEPKEGSRDQVIRRRRQVGAREPVGASVVLISLSLSSALTSSPSAPVPSKFPVLLELLGSLSLSLLAFPGSKFLIGSLA